MSKASRFSTLSEWTHYLEHLHPVEIQLGLTRIKEVADRMDLLQPQSKIITVAGTNGKGSTVAMLETIYGLAGYQVATYTSPHLSRFNERIRINGVPVSDEALCMAFQAVVDAQQSTALTYFEIVTLAALWHFKQCALDLIILEVGLGGRQDATNIIDADLAIITTIDFDHQQYLGDTLEAIGYEKAGVLREGQHFIYADESPPESILKEAALKGCEFYQYAVDYQINESNEHWTLSINQHSVLQLPKPSIQLKAAASALLAVSLLENELPIPPRLYDQALNKVFLPGRLQYIPSEVNLLFDVSHNKQAASLLAECVKKLENNKSKVHAVFSALKDKDIFSLLKPLKDCVYHWYPAQLNLDRAADRGQIEQVFDALSIKPLAYFDSVEQAFEAAKSRAAPGDLIVVYGSFYTVGQAMDVWTKQNNQKEIS